MKKKSHSKVVILILNIFYEYLKLLTWNPDNVKTIYKHLPKECI